MQHKRGYADLDENFIQRYALIESIDVTPEKDSKTVLQEYCQGIGKQLPKYTLIEHTGPAHARTFKSRVDALHIYCEGTGTSKRAAELQAAEKLIKNKRITLSNQKKLAKANIEIDYISMAKLMPLPSNHRKIALVTDKLKLPACSLPLVGLALTHRSHKGKTNCSLGKDNSVLAFLGASVIEWIAFDTIIKNLSLDELSKAGGIREIVRTLVNASSISKIYDELLSQDDLLLGPGEKNLTHAAKSEFIQALFGVAFLAREANIENAQCLINDVPIFLDHFKNKPKQIDLSRDEIAPIKSVFQEKCQLLGINVKFRTNVLFRNKQRIAKPSIILESEHLTHALDIQGETQTSRMDNGKATSALESDIAQKYKNIFDQVFFSPPLPLDDKNEQYIKWIFEHTIKLAGQAGDKIGTLRVSKLLNKNLLGTKFLDFYKFEAFENSINFINELVDLQDNINKSALLKYYGHAGRDATSEKTNSLSQTLSHLETELAETDPLQEPYDLRDTYAFKRLISEATAYRLKSGEIICTTLGEIVEELTLLQRGKTNIFFQADPHEEIIEIDGAHLCLLHTLISAARQEKAVSIQISVVNEELCLAVNGFTPENQEAMFVSPLWGTLKALLPITNITTHASSVDICITSVNRKLSRKLSLEFWWQYHFRDPYELASNDRIASVLHDVKNSLLGFCFTSEYARSKSSGRERYLLAADAIGHIDTAMTALRVVKSLTKDTGTANISPIKISVFIKSLISELWSWIPNSVNLVFSPCDSLLEISTDEHRLRSLISNVVKNSVEAMNETGTIYISYKIEVELEGIEFIISDTGPGFSKEQLISLESGTPLKTSKKDGHGIGLMAVMLIAKQLGGNIVFWNGDTAGARVKIWTPSIHKQDDKGSDTNDKYSLG